MANRAVDRSFWWIVVNNGKRNFEQNCVTYKKIKTNVREGVNFNFSESVAIEVDLTRNKCGHVCQSKADLKNHERCYSRREKSFTTRYVAFLLAQSVKKMCLSLGTKTIIESLPKY